MWLYAVWSPVCFYLCSDEYRHGSKISCWKCPQFTRTSLFILEETMQMKVLKIEEILSRKMKVKDLPNLSSLLLELGPAHSPGYCIQLSSNINGKKMKSMVDSSSTLADLPENVWIQIFTGSNPRFRSRQRVRAVRGRREMLSLLAASAPPHM